VVLARACVPHRAGSQRLRDIAAALERIRVYCDGSTFEGFSSDSRPVEAVQFNFIVIGEAATTRP
jgi:uncharacterized protein with HEPN domain